MKKISSALFSAALICSVFTGISASAATVDDIAEAARAMGYTEDQIQQGYNAYYADPSAYTPEQLDQVLDLVNSSGDTIISTVPYVPDAPVVTTSVQASEETDAGLITLTAPDGSTFTRISTDDFIKLSYDEKMSYLSSFPQDKQQIIIDNMSPLEYRSIMKQAPTEKKLEIVDSISDVAEEMGLTVTVDEITADSLALSTRNSDGQLVSISNTKAVVEDTGYDRRWLFALIGCSLAAAVTGLVFVIRNFFGKDETAEKHE